MGGRGPGCYSPVVNVSSGLKCGKAIFCSGLIGGDAATIPRRRWIPSRTFPVARRPGGVVLVVGVTYNYQ